MGHPRKNILWTRHHHNDEHVRRINAINAAIKHKSKPTKPAPDGHESIDNSNSTLFPKLPLWAWVILSGILGLSALYFFVLRR